ncbi:MAG TPA: hypothetical protein VMH33_13035 [Solirubrobacterales bacterium]|nr:hypothetical protein [Solirubrobacterales bacterium]
MNRQLFRRTRLTLGLVALALAVGVFAAAGSASAATQHWAGASQVPYGASQSFTVQTVPDEEEFQIIWEPGGARVEIACRTLSGAGTVGNSAGGTTGTIESGLLELGGCQMGGSRCAIENGSISLPAMSQVTEKAGADQIWNTGSPTELNIVEAWPGSKCALARSWPVSAPLSATAVAGRPGVYEMPSDEFRIIGEPATISGIFTLKAPSGEHLVLSSEASPGAPHWYLGSAAWNTLAAGGSTAYLSNGPMSFGLKGEVYGAHFELSCSGAANGVSGSLSNPTGGGAGTASATATFGECAILNTGKSICLVQTPFSSTELAGVAIESGAIEFSPAVGTTIATFTVTNGGGTKKCNLAGTYTLSGKLIAGSEGDGYFDLSGGELRLDGEPMTASGRLALETSKGKSLRLQP